MRILGIDPGLRLTGYGCIEPCRGGGFAGHSIVEAGVFRLLKRPTRAGVGDDSEEAGEGLEGGDEELGVEPCLEVSDPLGRARVPLRSVSERLVELDRDFRELLGRVRPGVVAIEGLFSHYKHPATAIVMGHARGVICLAASLAGIPVIHYSATQIKKVLTGNGRAPKIQMQQAIQRELGLAKLPEPADVADALAIALCHYYLAAKRGAALPD